MAGIARSKVSLRIFGDKLNPVDITRRLGANPTTAYAKGDARVTGDVWRTGSWHLSASVCQPADINGQIAELLAKLTANPAVWASITAEYKVDIFCGLFMNGANEGFALSHEMMSALASRGIAIGFDVYAVNY
jgi:hypothetical protein